MSASDFDRDPHADRGLSRRTVLSRSATGVGIALTGSLNHLFGASPATALGQPARVGYGALIDDPAGLLSLPRGFSYSIVAQSGVTKLESGEPTPSDPDGTASFARRGAKGSVLINNHEISGTEPFPSRTSPATCTTPMRAAEPPRSWSTGAGGGCASTSASPGPTPTAPAAAPRGTRG